MLCEALEGTPSSSLDEELGAPESEEAEKKVSVNTNNSVLSNEKAAAMFAKSRALRDSFVQPGAAVRGRRERLHWHIPPIAFFYESHGK